VPVSKYPIYLRAVEITKGKYVGKIPKEKGESHGRGYVQRLFGRLHRGF
jgi:hypothetical protein